MHANRTLSSSSPRSQHHWFSAQLRDIALYVHVIIIVKADKKCTYIKQVPNQDEIPACWL